MSQITNRFLILDFIKIVAILGVVSIHTIYTVYARTDFFGGSSWYLANFINAFARSSIPLFIMVSGYLMLAKDYSFKDMLNKAFWRMFLPLFVWVLVYEFWSQYFFGVKENFLSIYQGYISGNLNIFYFFVIMIGLYLVTPVIKPFLRDRKNSEILLFSIVMLVISSIMTLGNYVLLHDQRIWNFVTLWIPYLGYYLFGHYLYLSNQKFTTKNFICALLTFIFGLSMVNFFNYLNMYWLQKGFLLFWYGNGGGLHFFDEFVSPAVIIMSLSLFTMIYVSRNAFESLPNFIKKIISYIGASTLGIYVLHSLVLNVLEVKYGMMIEYVSGDLWFFMISKIVIAFIISLILSLILRKIPLIKMIFGE